MDDKLKMSRTRLPADIKGKIAGYADKHLDEKSQASVKGRAENIFVKLERADGKK